MINNLSQNPSNISFKASVIANRQLILSTLSKDKKLTSEDFSVISKFLDKIDSFSKMKEDSIVDVSTKVDSGQSRIICNVYDKTKRFFAPVTQRTVKMLVGEEAYREQHLHSMQMLIKNVAATRNSIDKITNTITNLNGKHFDAKNVEKCFEKYDFSTSFIEALNEGFNPTKKIIQMFKAIDKKTKPETEISANILRNRGETNKLSPAYFVLSFKNGEKVEEKRILLSELFKKPLADRLSQP
jgi:hypothetical protein